jgi:trigger factor
MSVVESIEETGTCRKKLTVKVPLPAVEAEVIRVENEYRSRARIPGFRKGKVPVRIVQQRFGEDIKQEVIERLIPRYWHQAQAESDLKPLLPPSVESVEFEEGTELTFVATVETRPEIEPLDLESFDLPNPPGDPSDQEVDEAIEDIRGKVAKRVEVDRPATQGDTVAGNLSRHETAEAGAGEESANTQAVEFEVGDESVWEELSLAVTGRSVGQTADFERSEPEGDEPQIKRFSLEITAIKERELAELDDAFAASLGDFKSFDDFQADVRGRVRMAKEQNRRHLRERALLDQLRERHSFELPEGVVHKEIEQLLREYAEELTARGADLNSESIDWKELGEQARPQAERRVHARLLLDAAAEKMDLATSEAEFEAALTEIARAQGKSAMSLRSDLDKAGKLSDLRSQLLRQKVIRTLLQEGADEEPVENEVDDVDQVDRIDNAEEAESVES